MVSIATSNKDYTIQRYYISHKLDKPSNSIHTATHKLPIKTTDTAKTKFKLTWTKRETWFRGVVLWPPSVNCYCSERIRQISKKWKLLSYIECLFNNALESSYAIYKLLFNDLMLKIIDCRFYMYAELVLPCTVGVKALAFLSFSYVYCECTTYLALPRPPLFSSGTKGRSLQPK